jgi:hypothetical protein
MKQWSMIQAFWNRMMLVSKTNSFKMFFNKRAQCNEIKSVVCNKTNADENEQGRGSDKICMMMTRLACNRAIESSYWRMDNDSDVGLLMGYVLYQLLIELEFMDLDTFPR